MEMIPGSSMVEHSAVNRRVPIVSARRGSDIALLVGDAGSVTDNLLRPSPTPTLSSCTIAAERGLFGTTLAVASSRFWRSEEHTSELQSRGHLVCRLLLEKKNKQKTKYLTTDITQQI